MIDAPVLMAAITAGGYRPKPCSGRAMYGKVCVGFDTEEHENPYAALGKVVAKAPGVAEAAAIVSGVERDGMGKASVIYWKAVPWPMDEPNEFDIDEGGNP